MFSKKTLMIVGLIALIVVSLTVFSLPNRQADTGPDAGGVALAVAGPFQKAVTATIQSMKGVWHHYFQLVSTAKENDRLREALSREKEKHNRVREAVLANERLRSLLDFKVSLPFEMVAAEVIGKDPSPWFKTIIIDKGEEDGVATAMPVVVADGIVGQIVETAGGYAKVLLLSDHNSAVDALVQRTRARGVIRGGAGGKCLFDYALRKDDIRVGDIVVSSGVDTVFPKGLRVGQVSEIVKRNAGIFQDVVITSYVDFDKIEEVLIILTPAKISE
ncbi:MAG: rod shape-determining protein MreC [Desulfobacterales bacterium]|jgi:rod shape-determining protein MreC|nr:rod shape-determining protein MreC [Desulfobacterales bacterium]